VCLDSHQFAACRSGTWYFSQTEQGTTSMRATVILALVSLLTFAFAFATRHAFFADVTPLSWDQEPASTSAMLMAYLLLSIENVAAVVAVISLVADVVLRIRRLMISQANS
jgi:hypothetical protein